MEENIILIITKSLNGEATEKELQELEYWKVASKENEEQFLKLAKIFKNASAVNYLPPEAKKQDWTKVQEHIRQNKNAPVKWYWMAAAITALLCISSLFFFQKQLDQSFNYRSISANEAIEKVELKDGSIVYLNKGSRLYVANTYNESERKLILEGEAFFEVAKNPLKTFIVELGETQTRVLGTKFNLYKKDDKTFLTVTEGKVSFKSDIGEELVLEKTQASFYNEKNNSLEQVAMNANFNAWLTQELFFDQSELQQVLQDIEKLYNINIQLDLLEESQKITTSFDHATIEEVLDELAIILNARVEKIPDGFLITGNK